MNKFKILLLATVCFVGCSEKNQKTQETASQKEEKSVAKESRNQVLFVVSNAHYYGKSEIESTNHFPEIILAHNEFKKAGYKVDFVSPKGGAIPIGYIRSSDSLIKDYLYDATFMDELEHTQKPTDIAPENYQAIYYPGGGSAMFTVPENQAIQEITAQIYERQGGIVATVCHGTAGIVDIKLSDGSYLVAGKEVNGFPDLFENKKAPYYQQFPFSIQEAIAAHGGIFRYSEEGWDGFMVADGRLVTGQDPTGADKVAQKVVALLTNKDATL